MASQIPVNVTASQLRSKLFALVSEFKDLAAGLDGLECSDASRAASGQADDAACRLAAVHEALFGDDFALFSDAARDPKDQEFGGLVLIHAPYGVA